MGHWKLKQEIEPIALAALLLSLLAVAAQLVAYMRGPDIRMLPPATVALYVDQAPEGMPIVRVAAPISYANLAQPPFGALVTSERMKFAVGSLESEQQWNAFGSIGLVGGNQTVTSTAPALPQALPAQSFVSHFTLFTPIRRDCTGPGCNPTADYVSPDQLLAAGATADRIRFEYSIETIDGDTVTASCDLKLHVLAKQRLAVLRKSALYARCHLPDEG
jgi:hypothetical protein